MKLTFKVLLSRQSFAPVGTRHD